MNRILSIETATTVCSVAIFEAENCIDILEISEQNAHSSKLTVLIEQLLQKHSLRIADFNAIAISKGPGSYTGLRIGTSVTKGLCYACSLPLIAIDTLQALAVTCKNSISQTSEIPLNAHFMPMIDARRMEVYTSLWNSNIENVLETSALIITEETISQFSSDKTYYLFGDGSEKCASSLKASHIHFVPNITASAQSIGILAYEKFKKQEFVDVAYFEPFYLKEFQATTPRVKL